jgi:hypothetical protein
MEVSDEVLFTFLDERARFFIEYSLRVRFPADVLPVESLNPANGSKASAKEAISVGPNTL